MKLTFTYTPEDMLELRDAPRGRLAERWRRLRTPQLRPARLMIAALGLQLFGSLLGAAASLWLAATRGSIGWLIACLAFLALPTLYAWAFLSSRSVNSILKQFTDDPHSTDPHTFELLEHGFELSTPQGAHGAEWSRLTRVVEMPNLLLLTTPATKFLIPRRAFTSPDQEREFLAIVRPHAADCAGGSPVQLTVAP